MKNAAAALGLILLLAGFLFGMILLVFAAASAFYMRDIEAAIFAALSFLVTYGCMKGIKAIVRNCFPKLKVPMYLICGIVALFGILSGIFMFGTNA